jgi:endo-1,4-beta-xylanase
MSRAVILRTRRTLLVAGGGAVAVVLAVVLAVVVPIVTPAAAATTLRSLADARGFAIGAAVDAGRLGQSAYRAVLDPEFNAVTPANEMKWDATEPTQGQFTYGRGDTVVSYAQGNGKKVRGHTLVWHSQLPGWVTGGSFTGDQLRQVMQNHIANVAGHFRGAVVDWDVVNEPFNDDGTRRQSVFQQKIGDGYIADALRAARQADPGARLYLNDYNIDGVNAKSTAMYDLVRSLRQQGVPVDGVGIQGHLILGQVPSTLRDNIARIAALGVDVKITELDIRIPTPADSTELAQQASDYRKVLDACLAVAGCRGVTTWGVGDADSWIPSVFPGQGAALLFDESYARKPAYDSVSAALGGPGTPPPSSPSPSATRSPSASPSPSASRSPSPSPPPSSPPPPSPPPTGAGCAASYAISTQWPGAFNADVTVRNTGTASLSSWTVRWTFANGQIITDLWNGTLVSNGPAVTVRNASWNGTVTPGATTAFGFTATWTTVNAIPTVSCSIP